MRQIETKRGTLIPNRQGGASSTVLRARGCIIHRAFSWSREGGREGGKSYTLAHLGGGRGEAKANPSPGRPRRGREGPSSPRVGPRRAPGRSRRRPGRAAPPPEAFPRQNAAGESVPARGGRRGAPPLLPSVRRNPRGGHLPTLLIPSPLHAAHIRLRLMWYTSTRDKMGDRNCFT